LHFRDPLAFQGQLTCMRLGHVGLSRLASAPVNYERRPNHIREAREEEYLVTIPQTSAVEFRQLGRDVRCEPGGFIIERGDEPYRFMYADPNDLFVLKVRKKVLAERVRQPDRFCARVVDATSGTASLFTTMVRHAQAQGGDASLSAGETIGRHLLELLGLALQDENDVEASSVSSVRAAHLNRVDQFIRAHLK
ncbi:DNA-binding protein, partial [Escherichia coli]|nr:DNA-binding protein [Escherichia coli]